MSDMDLEAFNSSEIFRNYVLIESAKEPKRLDAEAQLDEDLRVYSELEEFQNKVNSSPKLKTAFRKLQHIFINDSEATSKVDPTFVESVMLLQLEDE